LSETGWLKQPGIGVPLLSNETVPDGVPEPAVTVAVSVTASLVTGPAGLAVSVVVVVVAGPEPGVSTVAVTVCAV